jgi:hypothetical protein
MVPRSYLSCHICFRPFIWPTFFDVCPHIGWTYARRWFQSSPTLASTGMCYLPITTVLATALPIARGTCVTFSVTGLVQPWTLSSHAPRMPLLYSEAPFILSFSTCQSKKGTWAKNMHLVGRNRTWHKQFFFARSIFLILTRTLGILHVTTFDCLLIADLSLACHSLRT